MILNRNKFLLDSYLGGENLINRTDYIQKYPLESVAKYNARKERIAVLNLFEYFVSVYTNAIFSQEINISAIKNDKLKRFTDKATLKGLSLVEFLRSVSIFSTFLEVAIVIDAFSDNQKRKLLNKTDNEDITKTDVSTIADKHLYPYIQLVMPDNIDDKYINEYGDLEWIRFKFVTKDKSNPDIEAKEITKYVQWTKEYVKNGLIGSDGKIVWDLPVSHGLGEIPVILFSQSNDNETKTWLNKWEDLAKWQQTLTNWISLIDEEFHYLTFSFLAVEKTEDDNEDVKGALNNQSDGKNLVEYANKPPMWIQKQPQTQTVLETIKEMIKFLKFLFNFDVNDDTALFNQSGKAMELSRKELESLIVNKANGLEKLGNKIIRIVAKYENETISKEESIDFPDKYDGSSIADKVNLYLVTLTQGLSGLFNKQLRKDVVDLIKPDLSSKNPELRQQIFDDIDKTEMTPSLTDNIKKQANNTGVSGQQITSQEGGKGII